MNLPSSYTGVHMLRWHDEERVVCCPRGTALQEEYQSGREGFYLLLARKTFSTLVLVPVTRLDRIRTQAKGGQFRQHLFADV